MTHKALAFLVACLLIVAGAQAATIFSRTGPTLGNWELGGETNQVLATSWFQNFFTVNTAITALGIEDGGAGAVHFELRSGAPDGSVVTQSDVTLTASANYILFPVLFLGPGTYYIVASVPGSAIDGTLVASWAGLDNTNLNFQEVAAPGAGLPATPEYFQSTATTGFQAYPLELGFTVQGDVTTVPEPVTFTFVGAGLMALGLLRRRTLA
jgi:hypothetical protein